MAQQHLCPVLGLGAAGTRLDFDEAVAGIGRLRKHPPELEAFDFLAQGMHVGFDRLQGGVVGFVAGHLEEITAVSQALTDGTQGVDDGFERLLFASEILGTLRIIPDIGRLEPLADFFEAFALQIVVKDTPEAHRVGGAGR